MSTSWKIFLVGLALRWVPTEQLGRLLMVVACCMWLVEMAGNWLERYADRKQAEAKEEEEAE